MWFATARRFGRPILALVIGGGATCFYRAHVMDRRPTLLANELQPECVCKVLQLRVYHFRPPKMARFVNFDRIREDIVFASKTEISPEIVTITGTGIRPEDSDADICRAIGLDETYKLFRLDFVPRAGTSVDGISGGLLVAFRPRNERFKIQRLGLHSNSRDFMAFELSYAQKCRKCNPTPVVSLGFVVLSLDDVDRDEIWNELDEMLEKYGDPRRVFMGTVLVGDFNDKMEPKSRLGSCKDKRVLDYAALYRMPLSIGKIMDLPFVDKALVTESFCKVEPERDTGGDYLFFRMHVTRDDKENNCKATKCKNISPFRQ